MHARLNEIPRCVLWFQRGFCYSDLLYWLLLFFYAWVLSFSLLFLSMLLSTSYLHLSLWWSWFQSPSFSLFFFSFFPFPLSLRFPFYFELKIAFVIWLLSPYTKGSSVLYRKFVHPTLSNKEKVLTCWKILTCLEVDWILVQLRILMKMQMHNLSFCWCV